MPNPPKWLQDSWDQEIWLLTPEQRLNVRLLAAGKPQIASVMDMFQWLHDIRFTNVLWGLLPEEPFEGYQGCDNWRSRFIDDLGTLYRTHLFPDGVADIPDDGSIHVGDILPTTEDEISGPGS